MSDFGLSRVMGTETSMSTNNFGTVSTFSFPDDKDSMRPGWQADRLGTSASCSKAAAEASGLAQPRPVCQQHENQTTCACR